VNPISYLTEELARWIIEVVYVFGSAGMAVLATISNLLSLIPSQLVLPLTGYQVSQGCFAFSPVLVAATAGSLAGALILYALGRGLGEGSLHRLIRWFGQYVLLAKSDLDKASKAFDQHVGKAVLICRLLLGGTGIKRMPGWKLVVYTGLCSALRNRESISVGWVLGDRGAVCVDHQVRGAGGYS